MTAAAPGQAAYEAPPLVYDRWCHVDDPEITEDELAGMWNGESPAEREFWTATQAAVTAAAPADAAISAWIEDHPREFAAWVNAQRSIGGPAPACPNCDGSGTWRVPYADSVGEAKLACPHPVHETQARFGQVAYAAFRKAITDASPSPHTPYEDLPPANRGAFVAAADAVAVLATGITGRKLAIALETLETITGESCKDDDGKTLRIIAGEGLAQIADVGL